jgi:N-acetylmuramoyl-L-alanine amidase
MSQNSLVSTTIYPGQVLQVPDSTAKDTTQPVSTRWSNGYRIQATSQDIDLLARIISAEASDQPYNGMVAVGAVIINRVLSGEFPATISGVIYQPGQFEPVSNGWLWQTVVKPIHRAAALDALNGVDPTHGALYFFEYAKVSNPWLWARPWKVTIGTHRFTA